MLNEVGVKIKLVRSKDALCLTEAYKVRMRFLRCASMFVRKAKLSPFVFFGQAKTLERGTAKCPIRRLVCKSVTSRKAVLRSTTHSHRDRSREQYVFNGHASSNPFNVKRYNRTEIALYLDGQQQHALKPIEPD